MMVDEYAKKLLETKGISIDPSALFNSFVKVLEKADAAVSGNGGTMKGGLEQYAPTNGGPGTKMTTSNRDVKSINIDFMLAYMGTALKSPMKAGDSNPLNPATIIGDGASVAQEVADMKDDSQASQNDDDSQGNEGDSTLMLFNGGKTGSFVKKGEEADAQKDTKKRGTTFIFDQK